MDKLKELFMPDQEMMDRMWGGVSPRTLWMIRIALLAVLTLWFGLWYYLHTQAKQSRARVEQRRIEASRRRESARRQAAYQQVSEQYQKKTRAKHTLFGE